MCGIGAILRSHPPGASSLAPGSIPDAWLRVLDESIAHRGPHGAGTFRDCVQRGDGSIVEVALVHRRLSILDHKGGAQPMVHRERDSRGHEHKLAIVFNGCVYNHRELRTQLVALGRPFASDHSDTEVLLQGWIAWGPDVFDRVVGMVACILWDARTPSLVVSRTWPREKPIYRWMHVPTDVKQPTTIALASSVVGLDALRELARMPREQPNPEFVATWLAFGHARSSTPFPTIDCPDASLLTWPESIPISATPAPRTPRQFHMIKSGTALKDAIDHAITDAVRARLDADVPLGCLLSGGVDSSLIAALAAKAHPKLTTVCVRMPAKSYDESPYAEAVARHIGSTHHTIDVSAKPAEDLVGLIEQLGLPFGDSSLLPTYWACKAAREHVGVALTGDGGDELFFGYERYKAANMLRDWSWLLALVPPRLLASANPKGRLDKVRRLIIAARERSSRSIGAIFPRTMLDALIDPAISKAIEWGPLMGCDQLRDFDLEQTLPSDMLRKVDHASLSAGLEVRAPLLDQALVAEVGMQLNSRQLMPRGKLKGLLKAIARRHVPASIINRHKMGFAIPLGDWFRDDFGSLGTLLRDTLGSADPFPTSLLGLEINQRSVAQLLDEHMQSRQDHAQRLYMLLVLALWCRQTLDRRQRFATAIPMGTPGHGNGYRAT